MFLSWLHFSLFCSGDLKKSLPLLLLFLWSESSFQSPLYCLETEFMNEWNGYRKQQPVLALFTRIRGGRTLYCKGRSANWKFFKLHKIKLCSSISFARVGEQKEKIWFLSKSLGNKIKLESCTSLTYVMLECCYLCYFFHIFGLTLTQFWICQRIFHFRELWAKFAFSPQVMNSQPYFLTNAMIHVIWVGLIGSWKFLSHA